MIPSFKTYLKESVWMDIHKRSNGEIHRKEDGVNDMDKNQFFDYLVSHYVYTGQKPERYSIHKDTRGDNNTVILIPIYQYKDYADPYYLRIDYNIKGKTISPESYDKLDTDNSIMIRYDDWIKPEPSIFDKLDDRFGISEINEYDTLEGKTHTTYWNIYPPKGIGPCNQFFVDVIDYIIDNLEEPLYPTIKRKGFISESVWMDIHKRSNNEIERKEEDINLLNLDEFNNYLNSLYDGEIRISYDKQSQVEGLVISFARSKNHNPGVFSNWPVSLVYYTDRGMLSFSNKKFDDLCPHLYHELMPILNIEPDKEGFKFIVPDDNKKVDNKFVLYVLETIIEHLDPNEEEITIFKK